MNFIFDNINEDNLQQIASCIQFLCSHFLIIQHSSLVSLNALSAIFFESHWDNY